MPDSLTPEEVKVLKELLADYLAMGRVRKILTQIVLWLGGLATAGVGIWGFIAIVWRKP